ncbi:MAG: hypothetical protein GX620_04500 [Chloroflexi bacterium]|nr:hypothetical protein [Chloroflexota bacterium]
MGPGDGLPSFDLAMVNEDFTHFNLDAPEMMEWLQMVQDMVNVDQSIGKGEEQADFDWGSSGKLAIAHDASWGIPNFRETWVDFDWDFVPPPKGTRHANIPGCDFHAVNGQDYADHEGGWKLISFLNSESEDLWWAINMYGPPFRKQNVDKWVTEVSAGLPKNGWKYISEMTDAAAPWPVIPFYEELGVIHGNEISQIPTGERTVEDVVTSIVTQVDAMMAEKRNA